MKGVVKKVFKFNFKKHKFRHAKRKFYSVRILKNLDEISAVKSKTYLLPNGMAIFKNYKCDEVIRDKNTRIINELLSCYLMETMGIEYAKFEPAVFENKHGYVSYNVVNQNNRELLIPARKFIREIITYEPPYHYEEYKQAFEACRKFTTHGVKKMLSTIYKIMVFDVLTMQCERHNGNVYFIANKKAKKFRLSPLFDNELLFLSSYVNSKIQYDYEHIYSNSDQFCRQKKFISKISYQEYVKEVVKLAAENNMYRSILTKAINNLNLVDAIKQVEAQGYVINEVYKCFILDFFDKIKESVYKEYRLAVMRSRNEI